MNKLENASAETIYTLMMVCDPALEWVRAEPGHDWYWYYQNAKKEWQIWVDVRLDNFSADDYDSVLIEWLVNLKQLSLYGNQLTALPPEIGGLVNLKELYLYGNQLTALPPEIGGLVNLKQLSLYGNPIKDREAIREMLPNTEVVF